MTADRHLDWDGCVNVRELGGLTTADGRQIRQRAVVRGDSAHRLTAAGWFALQAHGIRTIVDLRDPTEYTGDTVPRPADLTTIALPLEDRDDVEFWQQWRHLSTTPLYYQAMLERRQERIAQILAAIAEAEPGGVLVHCAAGRDRTGLVTLVLLSLLDVPPDVIGADYALSAERLRERTEQLGQPDEDIHVQEQLRLANTSTQGAILAAVAALDAPAYLRDGGLSPDQQAALLTRLLGEP